MKKLSNLLGASVGVALLVVLGIVLVAVLQNATSSGRPGAQGYPSIQDKTLTAEADKQLSQGYPPPQATTIGAATMSSEASTWTPFPTFPPPPTPTLRPGPTATAMPLSSPAQDASGVITYLALGNDGVVPYALSVDSTAAGTQNAPKLLSTKVQGMMFPSPDGSRILIMTGMDVENSLSILYPDTGRIEPLFRKGLSPGPLFFGWHPNSRQVLIRAQQNYSDVGLWLVNVDTGEHTTLVVQYPSPNVAGGAVAPDGQKVVYFFQAGGMNSHDEMWVVNADGSNPKFVYSAPALSAPLWSPDGTKIAFGGQGLMIMNADGSDPHTVSKNVLGDSYLPSFAWSPDSRKIAIIAADDTTSVNPSLWSKGNFKGANIHIVNLETGEERPLLKDTGNIDPAWSPDGSQIAFASTRSGKSEIWAVSVDGTNLRQMTTTDQPVRFPHWRSP